MYNPLISIIIPVYNAEKYLNRCIDSIINQKYQNIEVILIDDGSTDDSLSICRKYANTDTRILVIHKDNGGVSSARNAGLKASHGDYISFVDSDDYVAENIYTSLLTFITYDLLTFGYTIKYDTLKSEKIIGDSTKIFHSEKQIAKYINDTYDMGFNALWNKLFKKELITDNFDETLSLGEDLLFVLQYIRNCKDIVYLSELALYNYTFNSNDSLAYRYRENMFTICKMLYIRAFGFVKKYDKNADCSKIIKCFVLNTMIHCVKIVNNNSLDKNQKKHMIYSIIKNKLWCDVFKNKVDYSKSENIFVFCVKHHFYYLIYLILTIRGKYKRNRQIKKGVVSYEK